MDYELFSQNVEEAKLTRIREKVKQKTELRRIPLRFGRLEITVSL